MNKQGKEKYKMYSLRHKRTPGNLMSEPNLVCKETRSLRKGLILNRINRVLPTEQLPPPQITFQFIKRKCLRNLLII